MSISTIPKDTKSQKKDQALFAELDRKRRGWSIWKAVSWLVVLSIIVVMFGGVTLVAATGVVTIPGISNVVYPSDPQPARVVAPTLFDLEKTIRGTSVTATGAISTTLTEGQLTSLVSADRMSQFRQSQLTVDPNGISFYGYYTKLSFGNPVVIQAKIAPSVDGAGVIACGLSQASVGRLSVPTQVIAAVEPILCEQLTNALMSQSFSLQSIQLNTQSVTLTYRPVIPAIPTASVIPSLTTGQ